MDEPIHVKVARALGWTTCKEGWGFHPPQYACDMVDPGVLICREATTGSDIMPRYDTDWSATGPLVERYRIGICEINTNFPELRWWAGLGRGPGGSYPSALAPSPLLAICHLILVLRNTGKLSLDSPSIQA